MKGHASPKQSFLFLSFYRFLLSSYQVGPTLPMFVLSIAFAALMLSIFFKNMGHSRPLFHLFLSFSHHKSITNCKSIDEVLGILTWGRRMVRADETTELWRPPLWCCLSLWTFSICASVFHPNPLFNVHWTHWKWHRSVDGRHHFHNLNWGRINRNSKLVSSCVA